MIAHFYMGIQKELDEKLKKLLTSMSESDNLIELSLLPIDFE